MLKRLPIKYIFRLVEIINAILKFHHFPNAWKTAIVVPIIKPGKNAQDPVSYRPISLLSSLSKVAEAVILTRLQEATESHMIPYQFGFRKQLSTAQQLLRITESIREGFESGWETGAVFLDIAKAFDRVWTDGLIYKLINMRIPGSIIMLIATYLQGRLFTVRVGSNLSSERVIRAGVVQGTKVGPILFNIFVNDIPSPRNCQTQLCLFADDTAVMSTGTSQTIMEDLNTYLTQLGKWLIQCKIKVNTDKCQAVYFTRRRSNPNPPMLYRRPIPWSNSTRYLGVTLDKKLTYKDHIENIPHKYDGVKAHLYPLMGRKAKLSLRYKLLLYKALLRPVISYSSPVWGAAAKTHIKKLESLQNSTLRMITDVPWFIRNKNILHDLKVPTIKDFFSKLAINFFNQIDNHSNPAIRSIPTYDPSTNRKKRRPRTLLLQDK
ncbi:putative RNA-directed DNA polymerase from transposon X-element [Araneus ventricosus]|uniref:Putative RNA-directed DNA polymerase from transposon X-element n=1 Tax=Araneus ventricosus TaxID=182803 RepID=A0A4Y2LX42_ARAVE|nr:putative RNA-directed DNA polymerase from transposon X-element [Araneus ventricosus]